MKQKAIFFDRDGTLIKEVHYLNQLSQIELCPGASALSQLKQQGYFLAMVTNQSGVSRGFFPESFVREAYDAINIQLSAMGASLDALEYCPHHPEGKAPFNLGCVCRKPQPGMIHRLSKRFKLDLDSSWVVGDKICDIELGHNAGLQSALVLTGHGQKEREKVIQKYPHTPVFADIGQFALHLLQR